MANIIVEAPRDGKYVPSKFYTITTNREDCLIVADINAPTSNTRNPLRDCQPMGIGLAGLSRNVPVVRGVALLTYPEMAPGNQMVLDNFMDDFANHLPPESQVLPVAAYIPRIARRGDEVETYDSFVFGLVKSEVKRRFSEHLPWVVDTVYEHRGGLINDKNLRLLRTRALGEEEERDYFSAAYILRRGNVIISSHSGKLRRLTQD